MLFPRLKTDVYRNKPPLIVRALGFEKNTFSDFYFFMPWPEGKGLKRCCACMFDKSPFVIFLIHAAQ